MTDKIEVKRGTKIDDQAAAKTSGPLGILTSLQSDNVEGQWHTGLTQCPYCGNVGWTSGLSNEEYVTVICGRCGYAFLA